MPNCEFNFCRVSIIIGFFFHFQSMWTILLMTIFHLTLGKMHLTTHDHTNTVKVTHKSIVTAVKWKKKKNRSAIYQKNYIIMGDDKPKNFFDVNFYRILGTMNQHCLLFSSRFITLTISIWFVIVCYESTHTFCFCINLILFLISYRSLRFLSNLFI